MTLLIGMSFSSGRCPNSRDAEMVNFDVQGHQRNLLGENAAIPPHPAPIPNFHHPVGLVPAQNVQMLSTGHHTHIPGSPYQLPFHNLYPGLVNPSLDALNSSYRFLPFPSSSELIYRTSWQQLPTAVEVNQRNLRILSPEVYLKFIYFSFHALWIKTCLESFLKFLLISSFCIIYHFWYSIRHVLHIVPLTSLHIN